MNYGKAINEENEGVFVVLASSDAVAEKPGAALHGLSSSDALTVGSDWREQHGASRISSTYQTSVPRVQNILHSITWTDSFYETSSAATTGSSDVVIAVFDLGVEGLRFRLALLSLIVTLGLVVCLYIGIQFTVDTFYNYSDSTGYVIVVWLILAGPILALSHLLATTLKRLSLVGRRHVAVTTRGICVDVSAFDATFNTTGTDQSQYSQQPPLALRRLFQFDAIERCYIREHGECQPTFQVVVVTKPTFATAAGAFTISDLVHGQALVDLVIALLENPSALSSESSTSMATTTAATMGPGATATVSPNAVA